MSSIFTLLMAIFTTISCSKEVDTKPKELLPNKNNFLAYRVVFTISVDENSFFIPELKSVPLLSLLQDQKSMVLKVSYTDSVTKKVIDSTYKLDLIDIPGRPNVKQTDTLVLSYGGSHTVLKIKTLNKASVVNFSIPIAGSPNKNYTTFHVPNISFSVPKDIVVSNEALFFTYVQEDQTANFGYSNGDFTGEKFR